MNHAVQSGYVTFRPRARLLKLLGEELISDEVVAVAELVKNAHDADATRVTVAFHGVTGPEGMIIVRDDGHGMDRKTLFNHWMEPAGTSKSGPKRQVTGKRRRVLGEKGVGRFAVDKLGRWLELISRPPGKRHEIWASFDWDQFDCEDQMLSDVRSRWSSRLASEIATNGTVLKMTGLRTCWSERMFRRLSTRLSRLISPATDHHDFTIHIESDEFPQYSGELRPEFLDRSPHRIEATFDGKQTVLINANGSHATKHLWNGSGDLRCGPVRVRVYAFDLEPTSLYKIGPSLEVRAWLREWSGISIYRDGFRVWPYGEPHDDWLRLDQRRVNNPVVRLSNNQVVGFVEISRDDNPELRDQTSREGLQQDRAFEDLRRLLYFVLQILEAERQTVRHPANNKQTSHPHKNNGTESISRTLEKLASIPGQPIGTELRQLGKQINATLTAEESRHRQLIDGYTHLAAFGQAAIGVQQVVQPLLTRISAECDRLRRSKTKFSGSAVTSSFKRIEESLTVIGDRIAMLAPLESGTCDHRKVVTDIVRELECCRTILDPLLRARGILMNLLGPKNAVLRVYMPPERFRLLMHTLTVNALDWLNGVKNPGITVTAHARENHCEIVFSDNGPGIRPELATRVFEPLFSGKENGRGMGLTLARNMVGLHGGTIEVLTDGRRRGANLRVLLPRKLSRATLNKH